MADNAKYYDENIKVIHDVSPSFDKTLPLKYWVDKRALDPNNEDTDFTYEFFLRPPHTDKDGQLLRNHVVVPRDLAGRSNIPGPDVDLRGVTVADIGFPLRPLQPGEKLALDPFGGIFDLNAKKPDTVGGVVDLTEVNAKLDKIISLLSK
jgi:hypothetical protein